MRGFRTDLAMESVGEEGGRLEGVRMSAHQGRGVEQNTAEAFFNDPQQPRTKEFLQTYKQRSLL